MATTLEELARIGKANYSRKFDSMRRSYRAAGARAQVGYDATPFGPTRKANYKSAWAVMPDHYDAKVKSPLEDKWERSWTSKMRE